MVLSRAVFWVAPLLLLAARLNAGTGLSAEELKMFQDPGGWEYVSVTDPDNGVQTTHTCFDGQPHPQECSGTLTFNADNTFIQKVHIHGNSVERNGKYELEDKKATLTDELGTSDGPYSLDVNAQAKQMTLQITQNAGVLVRIELKLEKEYKKQMQERSKRQ